MSNIHIKGRYSCTGCSSCKIVCPKDAIEMKLNDSGFLEPKIDYNKCIDCSVCTKVCYKYYDLEKDTSNKIDECFYWAGWSKDKEVRRNSSSGGVTHEILKWGLENNYNIIGCSYNYEKNMTEHIIVNKLEELKNIQGSKYIQSNFAEIKGKIDFNQKYIVVGTPCQIHGFKKIVEMRKKMKNFIFIDIFCHGVPSYKIWKLYKEYLKKFNIFKIDNVNFRYKENGWSSYSMRISDKNNLYVKHKENDPFLKLFLCNASLNKSCYSCKLRFNKITSDIKMGDFWGQEYEDNQDGVNLIIATNDNAKTILENLNDKIYLEEKSFDSIKKSQYHGETLYIPPYKDDINKMLDKNNELEDIMKKYFDNSISGKIKRKLFRLIGMKR